MNVSSIPGSVPHGLLVHPDGEHLIYPLGCTVVIENIKTHEQNFLSGHTNDVSCLAVSKSGKYVASGQVDIFQIVHRKSLAFVRSLASTMRLFNSRMVQIPTLL